jgi:hypothetical protein
MSVRLVAATETFWTIMSRLICARASASKIVAASPTLSGTPTTVILASLRSWATPAMIAASMVPSWRASSLMLPFTTVPSSWLNEDRTWIGMS